MSENEQRHIDELIGINLRAVEGIAGLARRGPHQKHHGCVSATFHVLDDIPEDLRHGLFKRKGKYRALIRFSNSLKADDRKGDAHGMAIKVLGVEGRKLLEGREHERAQDFLLIDNETLPTGNPSVYGMVNRFRRGQSWIVKLAALLRLVLFHLPVMIRVRHMTSKKPSSPLHSEYFSTTPYALGPQRVKFVARPLRPSAGKGVNSAHGLGDALAKALAEREVEFEFGVDIQTDRRTQPIQRPEISWSKAGAQREWLARIVIHRQMVDRADALAENLSFSPWHALVEQEPLGYINRARRPVYRELARYRHRLNRIVPLESSEAPASYHQFPPPVFGDLYWGLRRARRGLLALFLRLAEQWIKNAVECWPWILRLVESWPWLRRRVNRYLINRFAGMTAQRPLPLALWTPGEKPVASADPRTFGTHVSWPGLVDRSFTGRHLPPMDAADMADLPAPAKVVELFERRKKGEKEIVKLSDQSSALLCFFAQWLSDSFLRTHPDDRRLNTSTHELDLCQIYGLGQGSTLKLRAKQRGLLKSRQTDRGEFPPFLVDYRTLEVKDEFADICFDPPLAAKFCHRHPPRNSARRLHEMLSKSPGPWSVEPRRWRRHYVGGLDRANSTLLYAALNTLFLREHNRIAAGLSKRYRTNDDNWLFETARSINIVKYLKILIEDYLGHLAGPTFKIKVEPGFADRCLWYRTNRISLEFNLLYRWHSLVPDRFWIEDDSAACGRRILENRKFRFNNRLVEKYGIERLFDSASRQPAGQVGLHNTPCFLVEAERKTIEFARQFRLAPFNAYRRRWDLDPYRSFYDMTGGDAALAKEIEKLYPDRNGVAGVDRVEFSIGLFAEARQKDSVLPTLLSFMVASDAFSHALTNPLLAAYVYDEGALTDYGLQEFDRVGSLADIVKDNIAPGMELPVTSFALIKPG